MVRIKKSLYQKLYFSLKEKWKGHKELWSLNILPVSRGLVLHLSSVKPGTPCSDRCRRQLHKTQTLWTLKQILYVPLLHFPISSKLKDIEIMNLSNERSQTGTAKDDGQLGHAHYSSAYIFFSQLALFLQMNSLEPARVLWLMDGGRKIVFTDTNAAAGAE